MISLLQSFLLGPWRFVVFRALCQRCNLRCSFLQTNINRRNPCNVLAKRLPLLWLPPGGGGGGAWEFAHKGAGWVAVRDLAEVLG